MSCNKNNIEEGQGIEHASNEMEVIDSQTTQQNNEQVPAHNEFVVTEEYLQQRLKDAVECCKKKDFDGAENIFSDLMIHAVKFYKSETHLSMSKFFYFYGDMLLSKLESNPDVFGDQAQKKVAPDANGQIPVENSTNNATAQSSETKQMVADQEGEAQQHEEGGEEEEEEGDAREEVEEVVQLDTVIFKDENVEIRDETKEADETVVEGSATSGIAKVHVDPVDDLQLAWEHLELSRKIYNMELAEIQQSSDEDKKTRQVQTMKQIIEISLRIGDLESWRDNLAEAVSEYSKALELSKVVEDNQVSRNLGSIYFQLGNAILYENKDFCEDEALSNFVESLQILENCLSNKLQIPPNEIPSFKVLKKEDLNVTHLKHGFLDDDESKQIKDILKNLYEKIEDTLIQRDERDKYKKYQELMKQQSQNQNQFAQPSQTTAPVKNLGTFGSLKRKEPIQNQQEHLQPQMTQENQNANANNNNEQMVQTNPDGTISKQLKPLE